MKLKTVTRSLALLVISTLIQAEAGSPAIFTRQDLQGKSFKDGNLNKADFSEATLTGVNFSNATLKGANFTGANMENAYLAGANLEDADFTKAKLRGVTWTNVHAWRAKLVGCEIDLAGAILLDLSKLSFQLREDVIALQARDCGSLSFHNADLRRCTILGSAENVDFRGADLRGANFSHATNLDTARFGDAKYDAGTTWNIDPVKMRAVLVPGNESDNPDAPQAPSTHPLVGKWLILKGEKGVTESGSLNLHADRTFDWSYSASAPNVSGKWRESGDSILLLAGEKGENWTIKRTKSDEVLLHSDKNNERVGVLDR